MDLWHHYQSSADASGFFVGDTYGRTAHSIEENLIALWRKPLVRINRKDTEGVAEDFAHEQLRVYLRSFTFHLKEQGKLRLVDPQSESSFTKLRQLDLAGKYFNVPEWTFRTSDFPDTHEKLIVKPVGYQMLKNGSTVFTNFIDVRELESPFPWLFQKAIIGGSDITCLYIAGECIWFKSDFKRSESAIDWRKDIQTEHESKWDELDDEESKQVSACVRNYMEQAGLKYGRLDFIRDQEGVYWFLECNVNGEFGWLDNTTEELHSKFLNAILDPLTSIS